MKKIILSFALFTGIAISNAQSIQGHLTSKYIAVAGDKLLITGYEEKGSGSIYKAAYYDKNLNSSNEYEKEIPVQPATFNYQIPFGGQFAVWTGGKPGYFLKLSKELKELSFNEKTSASADLRDKEHVMLQQFQLGLENDPFGLGSGVAMFYSPRPNAIKNVRFLNTDIIDFDRKTGVVTRYKANETKMEPTFAPVWSARVTDNDKIKLTGFTHVDDDIIAGCFILKEDEWKDCVSEIDSKTGKVIFFKEVQFPENNEIFNISNTYYDKTTGNLVVAGQLLLKGKGRDSFNALGILVYDPKGTIISSKKIEFPEFNVDEPQGFDFKDKHIIVHAIGKLPNGNYFFGCENRVHGAPFSSEYFYSISPVSANAQAGSVAKAPGSKVELYSTVAYSYYELNSKLDIVNSNLKVVDNFSTKNTVTTYEGFDIADKKVIYSQLDKVHKTFSVIDLDSKDKSGTKLLEGSDYDFRTLEKSPTKQDIYICYVLGDQVMIFRKPSDTDSYTIKAVSVN